MCNLLVWLRRAWSVLTLPAVNPSDLDGLLYDEECEVWEPDELYNGHLHWSTDVPSPGSSSPFLPGEGQPQ
jgi:hypothetical protein